MSEVDPTTYFEENNFQESLVLSISHSPETHTLTFVVDYADIEWILLQMSRNKQSLPRQQRAYDRDFRLLTFNDVANVVRNKSSYRHGFLGFNAPDLNLEPGSDLTVTIHYISVKRRSDEYTGKIGLGSFGVYKFRFGSFAVDRKLGKGVAVGPQQWQYNDAVSGAPFDFYNPFADWSSSGR